MKYDLDGIDTTGPSLDGIEDHLAWVGDVEANNPTPADLETKSLGSIGGVTWNPRLHPRDAHGRWTETLGDMLVPGALDAADAVDDMEPALLDALGRTKEIDWWDTFPDKFRGKVKANLAALLADRMDVSTADLIAAAEPAFLTPNGEPFKYDPDGYVARDKDGYLDTRSAENYAKHPRSKPVNGWTPDYRMGSEEGDRLIRETVVSTLVEQWARTSNGEEVKSLVMQRAAQDEFGVTDAAEWTFSGELDAIRAEYLPRFQAAVDDDYAAHGAVYRAFLRAQYDATQEWFAERGIKAIRLYRGVQPAVDPYDRPLPGVEDPPVGDGVTVTTRPLSSWAYTLDGAAMFGENGWMLDTIVPVERVLSQGITGVGCLPETEVVILGGPVTVNSREFTEDDYARAVDGWGASGKAAKAPALFNVDNAANADWPKRTDDRRPGRTT